MGVNKGFACTTGGDWWRLRARTAMVGKGLSREPRAVDGDHDLSACNLDSMLVYVESEPRVQPEA